jgi:hypothetical protein
MASKGSRAWERRHGNDAFRGEAREQFAEHLLRVDARAETGLAKFDRADDRGLRRPSAIARLLASAEPPDAVLQGAPLLPQAEVHGIPPEAVRPPCGRRQVS